MTNLRYQEALDWCRKSSGPGNKGNSSFVHTVLIELSVTVAHRNLRYHKCCRIFALLLRRIVAFGARGTGH